MTRNLPGTSPRPFAPPLAMSTPTSSVIPGPTFSPIPIRVKDQEQEKEKEDSPSNDAATTTRPHPKPKMPSPKLRLEVHDLSHPGVAIFFATTNAQQILTEAYTFVLTNLCTTSERQISAQEVRSITLVLREMDGVAFTKGLELDDSHKQIHLSIRYIASQPPALQASEIRGVLFHEMVHCWQWFAHDTAPGGLVEGVADWVRLKAGLAPPPWKRELKDNWDAAYQHTAYFLEWAEKKCGEGGVVKLNAACKDTYEEEKVWRKAFGKSVGELWEEYKKTFESS